MSDLGKFKNLKSNANQGAEMAVIDPLEGEPLGIFITLAGMDSDTYQGLELKHQRVHLKNVRRQAQKMRGMRNPNFVPEIDPDLVTEQDLEKLVGVTLSWRTEDEGDVVVIDGERLECTPENVAKVYKEMPWIMEQVNYFIADRANFTNT